MNYYERHVGDYLKDTSHLSLLEHGIYGRLLDVYYTREGALPADQVARLIGARSKDEKAALDAVLTEFFVLDAGAWIQSRCDREIARYRDKQAKAKRSADARWKPKTEHADGSAGAMRTHTGGNAPQSPVTSHQTQYSVPDGTGGKPPTPAPVLPQPAAPEAGQPALPSAELSKSDLWKAAVSLLDGQGMPEPQARAFIGKLSKDFPEGDTVLEAVREAIATQPADARAWLSAACQRTAGRRPAAGRRPTSHTGLAGQNYSKGVNADGTFA